MSLRIYTIRSLQQRFGRTMLTLLSIVIGVAAAVAIGLGTATTRNAYKQMFSLATGKANLEIDGKGGKSFPQDVYDQVAQVPGVEAAAPLIQRTRSMTIGEDRRLRLEVLGIVPALDQQVREYDVVAGRMIRTGFDELSIEQGFAAYLGLKVGDHVRMTTNLPHSTFTIVGFYKPRSGTPFTQLAMALLPLDRAQSHFNGRFVSRDSIDKIQIVTQANLDPTVVQKSVAAILPENLQVHHPAANTQLMQETLRSAEHGLRLTTLFSLLMAAFIILNTFLMNVTERRRHLAIMRAIGATRRQIFWSLLAESLVLGIIGTLIGIACGLLAAWLVTWVNSRVFHINLPSLSDVITPTPFLVGAGFGLTMSLAGAIVPAIIASKVSPLEGINRVPRVASGQRTRLLLSLGILFTGGSLAAIAASVVGFLPIRDVSYFGPPLLVGIVLVDSVFLAPQAALVAWLLKGWVRVEAQLALKQVLRNPTRSALTVSVLFIAGSAGIGIANTILDNVDNVQQWYAQAIVGDYFVRAMMPDLATGTASDLPEGIAQELEHVPHIQKPLEGASFVEARVAQSTAADGDMVTAIVIARLFVEKTPAFDLISGDRERLKAQLHDGQVVVGSVLAQTLNLKVGDKLALETNEGIQRVPICGIANEYMVGGMAVHMYRDLAVQWLGVQGYDGFIIRCEEGYAQDAKPQLERIAKKYDVFLLTPGDLKHNLDQITQGVEWSLWVLVLLGFVVAAFGMINTLTMNVLEQTHEIGLLRIVAMTKTQVYRTVLAQALIISGVGLPPGILMGVAVSYVVHLAIQPISGHSIAFQLHPKLLLATFVGALVIAICAAIAPARRASRINLVEALLYE